MSEQGWERTGSDGAFIGVLTGVDNVREGSGERAWQRARESGRAGERESGKASDHPDAAAAKGEMMTQHFRREHFTHRAPSDDAA
ncbi:MAG: hypothetical protein M3Y58_14655, partial [Chloroflexota bacterium]|nr:hypothetical protein [Chloroflexota bacterium]